MSARIMRNLILYHEPGRFAGWPANNGIWAWGNEIVVCFDVGQYKSSDWAHSYDTDRPLTIRQARSLDGGERWEIEDPAGLNGEVCASLPKCDFSHPDLAVKCRHDRLFVSYDRARNWQGPFGIPNFGYRLTSRTDYHVIGPRECLFFSSAFEPKVEAGIQDRAFCARASDGGMTFEFLGWMSGDPISVRSVMPSTVRAANSCLVSAMRRRLDTKVSGRTQQRNWIDAYHSSDDGRTWPFLSKVADTASDLQWNGNPPSLARLGDGRLCVTYGFRGAPFGIRARLSNDHGVTWGEELVLRDDARSWDIGYTRTIQRPDGALLTVYYYTTAAMPEQHIAATIWEAQ
jgi:hypothetical protein